MYTTYFGFRRAPFSVTPDFRFFYANSLYHEALAAMRYGIEAKKGLIVVTGEVGTGKTTLLRRLMWTSDATIHPVFVFNTELSFTGLLRNILGELGLRKDKDKSTMIERLNRYLLEQTEKGHVFSLLIDEGQNLDDKTLDGLRLLSNLETDKEKLLQIVLVGQPELLQRLDRPRLRQLRQRVAIQCQLAPLERAEVGPYIDLRLKVVGYEGEQLFAADAAAEIALYSRGIPRLINIICDNALLIAYATSQKRVTADMIREVARDIRLGVPAETEMTGTPAVNITSENKKDERFRATIAKATEDTPRHPARVGMWASVLLFALAGVASFMYTLHGKDRLPGAVLSMAQRVQSEKDDPLADPVASTAEPHEVRTATKKAQSYSTPEPQAQEKSFASPISGVDRPIRLRTRGMFRPKTYPQENWLASPITRTNEPDKIAQRATDHQVSGSLNSYQETLAEAEKPELDALMRVELAAEIEKQKKLYKVREGDHLYGILRKQFGIDGNEEMREALDRVKELNLQKKNWDVLLVGEVLIFPVQLAALPRSR